jgi:protein TonB
MKYILSLFCIISLPLFGQEVTAQHVAETTMIYHPMPVSQIPRQDPNTIFSICQQMPKFTGDMNKYISDNIHYPDAEKKAGITGTVYITFVVERDGSLSGVKVLRGVVNGAGLDAEGVRVISSMPKWIPGVQGGQVVRARMNIPIHFQLN